LAAPFYDSNTIRDYRYYRHRYGMSGAADFKLNDNTSFYANGIYSDLKDWGDKWYYKPSRSCSPLLVSTAAKLQRRLPFIPPASAPMLRWEPSFWRASFGKQVLVYGVASASYSYEVDSAGNPRLTSWNGPSLGNTAITA